MSEEVKSQTEGNEVAEVSDDELAGLLAQNQKLQEKENEGEGIKADYLILAKTGTKALQRSQKDLYIQGLQIGDIFLQKEKKILGNELKVVPLAFLNLYQEKESTANDAKFFGMWNKEQAVSFPVADGSYFNRQLPNGHILVPVNWVCVTVIGHHEIENAVIAFKSTGSRIWKKWKEDAKARSGSSATLVYLLKEGLYNNDKFEWTDFDFEYAENLLETDKEEALYCLKKSNAIREAYEKSTFVGNHDVSALTAKKTTVYIEDASDVEDSTDDEEAGF
jgi:hypothetical protein